MKSTMVKIEKGKKVKYSDGRICEIADFYLAPNGAQDNTLICMVIAYTNNSTVQATANHFTALDDEVYTECYPSVVLMEATDERKKKVTGINESIVGQFHGALTTSMSQSFRQGLLVGLEFAIQAIEESSLDTGLPGIDRAYIFKHLGVTQEEVEEACK